MQIIRRLTVPTGDILVVRGAHGLLELVSLGDYGKDVNLKCDALGLSREPEAVRHQSLLPLTEKWVVTISTQYGCGMDCPYCDVPLVGPGKNATFEDLIGQIIAGLQVHPEVTRTKRLNVHFARMGEPSWNPNVLDCAKWLHEHLGPEHDVVHPVVSTIMPRRNEWLKTFVHTWMRIKNRLYSGNAGLQISVNSTDPKQRAYYFNGQALDLWEIAKIMDGVYPSGRKITLNFAVTDEAVIDPDELLKWFDPQLYIVKLTPMHKTATAEEHGIETGGDYTTFAPYAGHEAALRAAGYDVLVFIASVEEDLGRITCGNAILSGSLPLVDYAEVPVAGDA